MSASSRECSARLHARATGKFVHQEDAEVTFSLKVFFETYLPLHRFRSFDEYTPDSDRPSDTLAERAMAHRGQRKFHAYIRETPCCRRACTSLRRWREPV